MHYRDLDRKMQRDLPKGITSQAHLSQHESDGAPCVHRPATRRSMAPKHTRDPMTEFMLTRKKCFIDCKLSDMLLPPHWEVNELPRPLQNVLQLGWCKKTAQTQSAPAFTMQR